MEDIIDTIQVAKDRANLIRGEPWTRHNELMDREIISYEQLKEKILSLKNKKVAAAMCLIYLTGSRAREVLRGHNRKTNEAYPSIKFKSISVSENGEYVTIITPVEKLRDSPKVKKNPRLRHKRAFIKFDLNDMYYPLFNILNEYMDSFSEEQKNNPETELFNFSYQYFAKQLADNLCWNTHYLRHLRASHLVQNHNFNDTELRHFFGWITGEMPSRYTHMNDEVIMEKLFN